MFTMFTALPSRHSCGGRLETASLSKEWCPLKQDNNAPASHNCSQYPFLTTSTSEFSVPDAALACRGQNCLVSHHEMWLDSNVYLFPVTTVPSWLDAKHLGCSTNVLSLCCDFSAEGKKFLKSVALKFMCATIKNEVCFKSHSHAW